MINKIIQWNIRGAKTNINKLSPPQSTPQQFYVYKKLTSKKKNTLNIKHYLSYNFIKLTELQGAHQYSLTIPYFIVKL